MKFFYNKYVFCAIITMLAFLNGVSCLFLSPKANENVEPIKTELKKESMISNVKPKSELEVMKENLEKNSTSIDVVKKGFLPVKPEKTGEEQESINSEIVEEETNAEEEETNPDEEEATLQEDSDEVKIFKFSKVDKFSDSLKQIIYLGVPDTFEGNDQKLTKRNEQQIKKVLLDSVDAVLIEGFIGSCDNVMTVYPSNDVFDVMTLYQQSWHEKESKHFKRFAKSFMFIPEELLYTIYTSLANNVSCYGLDSYSTEKSYNKFYQSYMRNSANVNTTSEFNSTVIDSNFENLISVPENKEIMVKWLDGRIDGFISEVKKYAIGPKYNKIVMVGSLNHMNMIKEELSQEYQFDGDRFDSEGEDEEE